MTSTPVRDTESFHLMCAEVRALVDALLKELNMGAGMERGHWLGALEALGASNGHTLGTAMRENHVDLDLMERYFERCISTAARQYHAPASDSDAPVVPHISRDVTFLDLVSHALVYLTRAPLLQEKDWGRSSLAAQDKVVSDAVLKALMAIVEKSTWMEPVPQPAGGGGDARSRRSARDTQSRRSGATSSSRRPPAGDTGSVRPHALDDSRSRRTRQDDRGSVRTSGRRDDSASRRTRTRADDTTSRRSHKPPSDSASRRSHKPSDSASRRSRAQGDSESRRSHKPASDNASRRSHKPADDTTSRRPSGRDDDRSSARTFGRRRAGGGGESASKMSALAARMHAARVQPVFEAPANDDTSTRRPTGGDLDGRSVRTADMGVLTSCIHGKPLPSGAALVPRNEGGTLPPADRKPRPMAASDSMSMAILRKERGAGGGDAASSSSSRRHGKRGGSDTRSRSSRMTAGVVADVRSKAFAQGMSPLDEVSGPSDDESATARGWR